MNRLYQAYKALKAKCYGAFCWRYNRFYFRLNGVRYGEGFMVNGFPVLKIDPLSHVEIGNHCVFTSGSVNPLCSNRRMVICSRPETELLIGDHCGFSSTIINIRKSVRIGSHVVCGANVIFMDSDAHSLSYLDRRDIGQDMQNKVDRGIVVGDDVLIGMNTVILKGVHIGNRSVIAANSVVTKDIPDDCVAGGHPAKVIRFLNT